MRPIALAALLCLSAAPAWAVDRLPTYDEFKSESIYSGPLARPLLIDKEAKQFRTRLIEGARNRPNFASRYRVVIWGCGTSCVMAATIDSATGRVVFVPFSVCCYAGKMDEPDWESIQFRADSRLIVFHGQRNEEGINGDHYYSFDGGTFKFIATKEVKGADETPAAVTPVSTPQEVQTCQKIDDGSARLKCYDAVLNYKR